MVRRSARELPTRLDADLVRYCESVYGDLQRWLTSYVGDPRVAEELCQDALVRLVENWHDVREMDCPDAWVTRVAVNLSRSRWRRLSAQRRAMRRLAEPPPSTADALHAIAIRDALARLPERQRCAITLRYLRDLPVADVALLMRCSPATVKTHLQRALQSLRQSALVDRGEDVGE